MSNEAACFISFHVMFLSDDDITIEKVGFITLEEAGFSQLVEHLLMMLWIVGLIPLGRSSELFLIPATAPEIV